MSCYSLNTLVTVVLRAICLSGRVLPYYISKSFTQMVLFVARNFEVVDNTRHAPCRHYEEFSVVWWRDKSARIPWPHKGRESWKHVVLERRRFLCHVFGWRPLCYSTETAATLNLSVLHCYHEMHLPHMIRYCDSKISFLKSINGKACTRVPWQWSTALALATGTVAVRYSISHTFSCHALHPEGR
jgi:hypothetical protein